MYREGPPGSPFHTLLAEGFVDGPVDIGLCVSWEATLYKNWWPQYTVPTFKIVSSSSLQKVRTGEEISLIRVKPPWPVTEREAILHSFEVEFFQEQLILVLLKTIPSDENIDLRTHGFSNAGIPDAKDVVRIDIVGGFALQKVSPNRSYFRVIANMDIKLDFVPPSLLLCLDLRFFFAGGASQPQNVLDPEEHEALIAMFNRWGISSSLSKIQWNISGEICSGGALGDFSTYDNPTFNPGILCDCQPNNTHDSACHITRLKAIDMGLVGHIPPELEVLKFIDNVDLSKNYLTGSIPPFFGNFSAMKYVSLSFNSLSGSIPKEIGKLQNLISLGIGINNFSGPLPPEIGNITNLQKL